MLNIGIVSFQLDAHAWLVKHSLEKRAGISAHVLAADTVAGRGGISWSLGHSSGARVQDATGAVVELRALDAVWYRRLTKHQVLPDGEYDARTSEFVRAECSSTLRGVLLNDVRGAWVSHPEATSNAGNALVQLRVAREVGFRVPRTLVSQVPDDIRDFARGLDNRVIVKDVEGTAEVATATTVLQPELLTRDDNMAACPAIYQELVPGERHLRVVSFGDRSIAALLTAKELDWRYNASNSLTEYELDRATQNRIRSVLQALGLRMGVFDFKLADDDEPVWLEVNPQGQFLWVESEGGIILLEPFVDFLIEEARRAQAAPARAIAS